MATSIKKCGTASGLAGEACLLDPNQLKWNSLWGMVRSVINTGLFAVSYPIYIHFLGLEVFGIWIMLMAVVMYLQLGGLNLPQAATKFISENLVQKDITKVCQYATSIIVAVLGLGGIVLLMMFFGRGGLAGLLHAPETLRSQLPYLIQLTALITVMAVLAESLGGIVSGAGRMDWVFMIDTSTRVTIFLTSLPLLYWQYGISALFYSSIIGYAFYIGLVLWCIKRSLGFFPLRPTYFSWQILRHSARFSLPLLVGSMFSCFLQPFNRILLGLAISPVAVSIYDIANRAALMSRGLIETGLRPLMPQISSLKARADDRQIYFLSLQLVKAIILWATPIFILLFLGIDYLAPLWLGKAANPEINSNFRIILWGAYANLLIIPLYYTFMGMGQVGRCFRLHLVQTIVNVILACLGVWFVREIWVVSLAASMGMAIGALDLIWVFVCSNNIDRGGLVRGLKTLAIPILVFAPLFVLHRHLGLFIGYFAVAGSLYIYRLLKTGTNTISGFTSSFL